MPIKALVIALLAVAIGCGAASHANQLPGVGANDRRVRVEPSGPPWDAIAKVQTNIGTRCTGVLIAADVVLTAAHCLYNPRTLALLQPVSLHVLFGFEGGRYRWHMLVGRYEVGRGFDGRQRGKAIEADWVLLYLIGAIPPAVRPLPVASTPPEPGSMVALAGFNKDEPLLLMGDLACRITGAVDIPNGRLLAHDCSATQGTSGGPLLKKLGSGWEIIGINIGVMRANNIALWSMGFVGKH